MRSKRKINIRCEICGKLYNEDGTKGSISINEFKRCDCGNCDDSRFVRANACPECLDKPFDFVTSLIKGE